MRYRLMTQTTHEPLDALDLHVLARAYSAAWRRLYQSTPIRQHAIPSLNLLIDFVPGGVLADAPWPNARDADTAPPAATVAGLQGRGGGRT